MSAFEKLNGVKQIDPQSLIELSLSFAKEVNMTNRAAAEHICCELRAFMKEMDAVITLKDLDIDQSNHISFAESLNQG
jgi:hypothetical protein